MKILSRVERRKKRVSTNIFGTTERPRISVFRSNRYIYAQAIDDSKHTTVAAFSSAQLKKNSKARITKKDEAKQIGIELAAILKDKKIMAGVFDRGRFAYNGRVKSLAEGLREGGITI